MRKIIIHIKIIDRKTEGEYTHIDEDEDRSGISIELTTNTGVNGISKEKQLC
jgi:predicted DNA-binding helix-hairpin-helix protein